MITQIKSVDIESIVWKEIHLPIKSSIPNNRESKFPPKDPRSWWEMGQTRLQAGENIFVTSIYNPLKTLLNGTMVTVIKNKVTEIFDRMIPTPIKKSKKMKEKIKVIFLDIDGVVATERSWTKSISDWYETDDEDEVNDIREQKIENNAYVPDYNRMFWPFDPVAVKYLHHIVRNNEDVKIVLSSSWREDKTVRGIQHIFRLKGLQVPVISFTRELGDVDRGLEILDWFDKHPEYIVTHWCVLDDMGNTIRLHVGDKLIQIDENVGLDEPEYNRICELLELNK